MIVLGSVQATGRRLKGRRRKVEDIHPLELTWKWRMGPWKSIFHYKEVMFHFHVSSRESIGPLVPQIPAVFML